MTRTHSTQHSATAEPDAPTLVCRGRPFSPLRTIRLRTRRALPEERRRRALSLAAVRTLIAAHSITSRSLSRSTVCAFSGGDTSDARGITRFDRKWKKNANSDDVTGAFGEGCYRRQLGLLYAAVGLLCKKHAGRYLDTGRCQLHLKRGKVLRREPLNTCYERKTKNPN